jgi:hypothetical protein
VLEGDGRERRWTALNQMYPQLDMYTEFTDRQLSPVALEPVGGKPG